MYGGLFVVCIKHFQSTDDGYLYPEEGVYGRPLAVFVTERAALQYVEQVDKLIVQKEGWWANISRWQIFEADEVEQWVREWGVLDEGFHWYDVEELPVARLGDRASLSPRVMAYLQNHFDDDIRPKVNETHLVEIPMFVEEVLKRTGSFHEVFYVTGGDAASEFRKLMHDKGELERHRARYYQDVKATLEGSLFEDKGG